MTNCGTWMWQPLCCLYLYRCGLPHYGDSDPLGTSFPWAGREGEQKRQPAFPHPLFMSSVLTREMMPREAADAARRGLNLLCALYRGMY